MDITFASLLTPAGTVIAGGLVTAFVQLIKYAFPVVDARISGASMAFVFSFVLYLGAIYGVTAAIGVSVTADIMLNVFVAWLSCATTAVGIKSVVSHVQTTQGSITEAIPKE